MSIPSADDLASSPSTAEAYRQVIESVAQAVWQTDAAGQAVEDSPSWRAYTGQTQQQGRGEGWTAVIHPDDRAYALAQWQAAVRAQTPLNAEFRLQTPDGGWRWTNVRATPIRNPDGVITKWVGINIDISARKAAEAAQRVLEERQRLILESAKDYAIFTLDLDRKVTSWNTGGEAVVGYAEGDILGKKGDIIFTPEDRAEGAPEAEAETALREGVATNERWHLREGGERFWGSGLTRPLQDEHGETVGFLKIMRDLTEAKRAEETLRQSEARQAYLVRLGDALRPLSDAVEIQQAAMRVLGEHLETARTLYAEISTDDEHFIIADNYVRGDVPKMTGRFPLSAFGELAEEQRSGGLTVVDDVNGAIKSEEQLAAYRAIGVQAILGIPLHKGGRWIASVAVHNGVPRQWTPDEVSLAVETAERTWAAVERARAEEALRESELRQQLAIEAAELGTFMWHVQEDWSVTDERLRELCGMQNTSEASFAYAMANIIHADDREAYAAAAGKSLDPGGDGKFFIETRVVHPNGSVRWLAASGQTIFEGEPRQAARMYGTFADITGRKRREANLAFLAEVSADLVGLTSVEETMDLLGAKIGAHLGLARCISSEIRESENRAVFIGDWHSPELSGIPAEVPMSHFIGEEFRDRSRAGEIIAVPDVHQSLLVDGQQLEEVFQITSFVAVPLLREGVWKFMLAIYDAVPRDWTADEIHMIREVSTRIWTRVERARAEEAQAVSEEKFRTLFDSIDEGFSIIEVMQNAAGTVVDFQHREVNAAFEKHTGLRDIVGKTISEVMPQMESHWMEPIDHVVRTGEPIRIENYNAATNRWYQISHTRVGSAGSRLVGSVLDDISERKRHEANLAFLAETSADFAPLFSAEEIMERVGGRLAEHLHLSRCSFSIVDEDADRIEVLYDWRHHESLPALTGVHRVTDSLTDLGREHYRTGKLTVLNEIGANPMMNASPDVLRQIGFGSLLDVPHVQGGRWKFLLTVGRAEASEWRADEVELIRELASRVYLRIERARAEEALRDSEQRLRRMVNVPRVGVLTFDLEGTLLHANDAFLDMVGYSRAEFEGGVFHWRNFTPSEYVEVSEGVMKQIRETGRGGPYEKEYFRKDGSRVWLMFVAADLGDGTFVEYALDVSDRKKAEEALRDADRRKDEFLAMLAHELRNPMATLQNTILLLELTKGQDESLPLDRALAMMSREVTHLNRMVDDLLDVSRIGQGKIQLQKEPLELGLLIAEALEAARSLFESRGQTVTSHWPTEPVWVDGDRTRLTQVVRNLLTNAAKYTPDGGQIGVILEKARDRDQAVLRVRDTGIGIAADQLQAIFEVFAQVSTSLDRPQGGLGLGLAVVKQLVELHGGRVAIQSPGLGQGSEFTVSLPRLSDRRPSISATGDWRAGEARRILVVDDNADLALTTALLLRFKKFEAHTRLSGPKALEAVESLQPAAVLLDLGMPGMDGYETCRRLRKLPWGKQGVIVALTGYGQEEDKKRTREAGFDGHLVKPVGLKTLTEVLDKLLGIGE